MRQLATTTTVAFPSQEGHLFSYKTKHPLWPEGVFGGC